MHVLLVHDGSAAADAAARFVLLLGRGVATRLTVATTSRHARRAHRAAERVAAAAAGLALPTAVVPVTGRTATSLVGSLVDLVHDTAVTLVAVGATSRGVLSWRGGDLAHTLVRRSPAPVVVVGSAPTTVGGLLVCTALQTPHEAEALEPATRIAAATGARAEVLHVMSQLPRGGGTGDIAHEGHDLAWHRRHGTAEAERLDEVRRAFTDRGIDARATLRHGLVVDEIVAHARETAADLVVLGAHGDGHPSWLLADITGRVVRELTRPVLVVREPPAPST